MRGARAHDPRGRASTTQGVERARATRARQADQTRVAWEKPRWHLRAQRFACEPDAQKALTQQLKKCPEGLQVPTPRRAHPTHDRPGRPRKDAVPDGHLWQAAATVTLDAAAWERAVLRQACFLVATNVLDAAVLSDQELIHPDKEQHRVQRGFSFLKDPLFLASSVFVTRPERIVALSRVMVLCLLVYRLAEHRLREQLAATQQTVPSQVSKPTARPTMRWIFQCFEGTEQNIAGLEPLHEQVLGPAYENFYKPE